MTAHRGRKAETMKTDSQKLHNVLFYYIFIILFLISMLGFLMTSEFQRLHKEIEVIKNAVTTQNG